MKPTFIDTIKINEIGTNINNLVNEYNIEINKMFKRIADMPYITKEWVGYQAENYVKIVMQDKNDFIDFGERLLDLSKTIHNHADECERIIKKNISIES